MSAEAQSLMMPGVRWLPAGGTKERAAWMEKMQAVYPVDVKDTTGAGVDAWVVTPKHPAPKKGEPVLICLHGGGFTSDSGSQIESIPIAALTGTQVISVRYRLAPKFPFPAAVDDTVAVYGPLPALILEPKLRSNSASWDCRCRRRRASSPGTCDSRFLYGSGGLKDFSSMIETLKGLGMVPYVGDTTARTRCLRPCMRT